MTVPAPGDERLPSIVAGERDTLLAFLASLRAAVHCAVEGLCEADARRRLVPSRTTVLGIVNHLAVVEEYWGERRLTGAEIDTTGDGFDLGPGDTVASVRRRYAVAAARTDQAVRDVADLDQPLARGRHGLTVRWMLIHLVEETGRHAGHADILRELLDGAAD